MVTKWLEDGESGLTIVGGLLNPGFNVKIVVAINAIQASSLLLAASLGSRKAPSSSPDSSLGGQAQTSNPVRSSFENCCIDM